MQQTQTYKLNKPGVDDPITPVPLNENADKLEANLTRMDAAIVATDGRHCLDKLLGPVSPGEGETELNIDLSGIDKSKYGALIMFFVSRETTGHVNLNYNGSTCTTLLSAGSGVYGVKKVSGSGFVVLFPGAGNTQGFEACEGLISTGDRVNYCTTFRVGSPWMELDALQIKAFSENSAVTLYGLRA